MVTECDVWRLEVFFVGQLETELFELSLTLLLFVIKCSGEFLYFVSVIYSVEGVNEASTCICHLILKPGESLGDFIGMRILKDVRTTCPVVVAAEKVIK